MSYQVTYKQSYQYSTTKAGISIPTTLVVGTHLVDGWAKIDTGAEQCLFERSYADRLGIDLESGQSIRLTTLAGSFSAFGHQVTLITFDLAFDVMVYFAEDYAISRSVLGRNGWLRQVRLGLCDYDEMLYLSAYNEA